MITLHGCYSLPIFISLLSSVALMGCQTASFSKATELTSSITVPKEVSLSTIPLPQLLERLTYYDWQLTQVKGADGKIKPFKHQPLLVMDLTLDSLHFAEGCHRYEVFFNQTYQPPYLYRFSNFKTLMAASCQNGDKSDIQSALEHLFKPYDDNNFKFEPLSSSQSRPKMALSIANSATLIFSGTTKSQQHVSGIPITHELLQRYRWRLIRATDDNQKLIDDFHQPDVPITASFSTDKLRQSFGFSIGPHGTGGAYALSVNQTLLTGSDPSPAISFGTRLDNIRAKFTSVALNPSQLILNKQPEMASPQDGSQYSPQISPHYLLTQKVETGETLIWQSEEKPQR